MVGKNKKAVKRIYDMDENAVSSHVGKIRNNRIHNALNSALANTGFNYGLGYTYDKYKQ